MDAGKGLGRHCPRCGLPVPAWGAIHLPCLGYRLRYVLVVLGISAVIPVLNGSYFWTKKWIESRQEIARSQMMIDVARRALESPVKRTEVENESSRPAEKSVQASAPVQPPEKRVVAVREDLVPRPDVRVGDRWILRSEDHNNPQWSSVTERVVKSVSEVRLVVSSRNTANNYTRELTFSREWNVISTREPNGRGSDYTPPIQYFDFPLQPGKKWEVESTELQVGSGGSTRKFVLTATVMGWEDVTVPAGTFRALRIELKERIWAGTSVAIEATDVSWYAPRVKRSVKTEESSVNFWTCAVKSEVLRQPVSG